MFLAATAAVLHLLGALIHGLIRRHRGSGPEGLDTIVEASQQMGVLLHTHKQRLKRADLENHRGQTRDAGNKAEEPLEARVHFFYMPDSQAHNRRYWVELPPSNAGRWGTVINLATNEQRVTRGTQIPATAEWDARFIPVPNRYHLLVIALPDNAPLGYPFERALSQGSNVESLLTNGDWMAWRDVEVVEEKASGPPLMFDLPRRAAAILGRLNAEGWYLCWKKPSQSFS